MTIPDEAPETVPKADCIVRGIYHVRARNFHEDIAVWDGETFIGIRKKFSVEFLDHEYHHDDGPPFGTCTAIKFLCLLPDGIEARTNVPGEEPHTLVRYDPLFEFLKAAPLTFRQGRSE